ncbi:uncharacterized protein LOC108849903 [Raphanus sativus]|uniref:Uncharacterized protein LOC108849903 n=1 Tax=Raphanus sativus TaxID=3726 RepID=A0A6J0N2X5_RAPSA|nr:uncharacterized protein LOC108849903 [Raphanus sativus]
MNTAVWDGFYEITMGVVSWMGARKIPSLRSLLEVEAEAMRWTMMQMVRLHFTNVCFETDSKELMEAANQTGLNPVIHSYAQDIAAILASRRDYKVVFKCREGNRVADRVAKEAISLDNNASKLYSVMLVWIKSLVEEDQGSNW